MSTFLLMILIQTATANYEVRMAPIQTLAICERLRGEVLASMPKAKGVSYILTCVQSRDTMESPA